MSRVGKIATIIALVAAVGIVVALKRSNSARTVEDRTGRNPAAVSDVQDEEVRQNSAQNNRDSALPRLIDLGAGKCIPCKMMAPILEELKREYAGTLQVDFFDVWKNPDLARQYRVQIIPTQIFFDGSGKELFRHEGFMSKEDILAKWKQLGIDIRKGPKNEKRN